MGSDSKMIELPELVISLISEQLSYEDLRNLRATCRKLKVILDQRTFRSLHLLVKKYPFERELLHTGELISYASTFHVRGLDILKSTKFKSQFNGLRKLTVYHRRWYRSDEIEFVDLNDLNCFEGLLHLELKDVTIKNRKLSLRNLKIAFLENRNRETINFVLDCPRLQVLGLRYRTQPMLTQETGNSIRHLYLDYPKHSETYLFLLYSNSLSTICFSGYNGFERLNDFVLALIKRRVCLKSLKSIKLQEESLLFRALLENLAKLKSGFETKHIEVQINWKVMGRDDLIQMLDLLAKIFPVDPDDSEDSEDSDDPDDSEDLDDSDDSDDPVDPEDSFYFDNPNRNLLRHFGEKPILHCILPGVSDLRLESKEEVTLSKQLIGRLTNLDRLTIGKGIELDEEFFECALKACSGIWKLTIGSAHLSQQQLDRMPGSLPNLQILTLTDDFSLGHFDLHFLAKFKNLHSIRLDFNIERETMSNLFRHHTYWPDFKLKLRGMQSVWIYGQRFEIISGSRSTFDSRHESNKIIEFGCIEEAIEHYYCNDLFNTHWVPNI